MSNQISRKSKLITHGIASLFLIAGIILIALFGFQALDKNGLICGIGLASIYIIFLALKDLIYTNYDVEYNYEPVPLDYSSFVKPVKPYVNYDPKLIKASLNDTLEAKVKDTFNGINNALEELENSGYSADAKQGLRDLKNKHLMNTLALYSVLSETRREEGSPETVSLEETLDNINLHVNQIMESLDNERAEAFTAQSELLNKILSDTNSQEITTNQPFSASKGL